MLIKLGFILFLASACRCDDPTNYRLKMENITIDTYTINFVVKPNFHLPNQVVDGNMDIKFKTSAGDLKEIRIHYGPDNIKFEDKNVYLLEAQKNLIIFPIKRNETLAILTLTLTKPLIKDQFYTLQFQKFTTKLSATDMYGFYLSSYKDKDGKLKYLATTQFQPTYARRAFPCFDEPSYKAKFDISITVPNDYTAVSNTPAKPDSNNKYKFEVTPKMSTYLIAFVVSNFANVTIDKPPLSPMTIIVPQGKENEADYAKGESRRILDKLGNLTQINFWESSKLKKLDQAAIPDFSAGAMENWGLVTYRETALLYNKDYSTTKNMQRISQIIAHEFAHMWFGNLITTAWWSTTWLNEGFARYYEYFGPAEVYPDWDLPSQFAVEQVQTIMVQDALDSARPLTSEVYTPSEVKSKFDSITYNKGASVIRMMEHLIGKEKFKAGIKEYLGASQLDTTTPKRLFDAMQKQIPIKDADVTKIMNDWTTKHGYPVIKVVLLPNNTVTFQQEHFLYNGVSTITWQVPVWYKTKNSTTLKKMITDDKENLALGKLEEDDYILVNPEQIGYYRVQYDAKLLDRLVKVLTDDKRRDELSPVSRAQIVDDVMNLARAGKIKYPEAFKRIDWLAKESNYFPWYSALNNINFLRRRLPEGSLKTKITEHCESLMKALYASNQNKTVPAMLTTYVTPPKTVVDTYKLILGSQWACEFNNKLCTDKAKELMSKQMDEAAKYVIPPDLRSIAYCSAARHDETNKTWDYLWNRFQNSNFANENVTIITALGCSKDEAKLNWYLEMSLKDNKIRRQDAYSAFTAVLTGNPGGVAISLGFLEKYFDKISASYGSLNALSEVITSIGDRLTTKAQYDTLKKVLDANKGKEGYPEGAAKDALEVAQANLQWSQTAQDELNSYFVGSASRVTITWTLFVVLVAVFFRQ